MNNFIINGTKYTTKSQATQAVVSIIDSLGWETSDYEDQIGHWIINENEILINFDLVEENVDAVKYLLEINDGKGSIETRQFSSRSNAITYAEKYVNKLDYNPDIHEADFGEWAGDQNLAFQIKLQLIVNNTSQDSFERYYQILDLSPGATKEEIRYAYKQKVKKVHPDVGGSNKVMSEVSEAYQELMNTGNRKAETDKRIYPSATQSILLLALQGLLSPVDIDSSKPTKSLQDAARAERKGAEQLLGGLGALITGGIITGIGYNMASPGGTYLVSSGLFIIGVVNVLGGIANLLRGK